MQRRKNISASVDKAGMGYGVHALREVEPVERRAAIEPETEQQYMRLIAAGDREAFAYVTTEYMSDVYRFAYAILRDRAEAEDITQETFLRLWNKAGDWQPTGRLKSWLLRIAHNLCMDGLRGQKGKTAIDWTEMDLPDGRPGPTALYAEQEVTQAVTGALLSLPERQRTALMLVYLDDCSYAEAAQIMELSVEALESLLARGKGKLKDRLRASRKTLLENFGEGGE